jgi:hypothetical protein
MALRRFIHRLASVFRHNRTEDELERETAAHLFLLEDDFRRRGMTMDDARLAARRAAVSSTRWQFLGIGSPPQAREGQIS